MDMLGIDCWSLYLYQYLHLHLYLFLYLCLYVYFSQGGEGWHQERLISVDKSLTYRQLILSLCICICISLMHVFVFGFGFAVVFVSVFQPRRGRSASGEVERVDKS